MNSRESQDKLEQQLLEAIRHGADVQERRALYQQLAESGADVEAVAERIDRQLEKEKQQAEREAQKKEQDSRFSKTIGIIIVITAIGLLIVLAVIFWPRIASRLTSSNNGGDGSTNDVSGIVNTLESRLQNVENKLVGIEESHSPNSIDESPTSVPESSANENWRASGTINKLGTDQGLLGATVALFHRDPDTQLFQPIGTTITGEDGKFEIMNKEVPFSGDLLFQVVDLPEGWQLQQFAGEGNWQSTDLGSFAATFNTPLEIQPLSLEAHVDRSFSGEVRLGTTDQSLSAREGLPIMLFSSIDAGEWNEVDRAVTNDKGQFQFSEVPSGYSKEHFKFVAGIPEIYITEPVMETSHNVWQFSKQELVSAEPIGIGEFTDFVLDFKILEIVVPLEETGLSQGHEGAWQMITEGTEQPYWQIPVIEANEDIISATWTISLPPGVYELQPWIPESGSAVIDYSAVLSGDAGRSEGVNDCPTHFIRQDQAPANNWSKFTTSVDEVSMAVETPIWQDLLVSIRLTALGVSQDGRSLALGPIRLIVDETIEFQDCAD